MPRTQSVLGRYFLRALAVIVVAGLLFLLAGAAWSWHASRTYTVVYRLEAPQRAPSPADLERTAALLTQRLGLLGRDFRLSHAAARAVAPDRVEVSFRARWAPNEALAWATMPCRVEFRLVHPHDPLPEGQVPAGYEVKVYRDQQFLLSKPGDLQTVRHSYAVEQRPALVTEGVQEASIATSGMHKMAVLTFRFGPKDADAFASMTALNVGRKMAMLIDGEMFLPPKQIDGPITGGAVQISGYYQLPPLRKLVKVLNTGPLPGKLEEVSRAAR